MINIASLSKDDISKWVKYRASDGHTEKGKIKSWNDEFIFVVYRCNNEWNRFQDFTGAATKPENLIFLAGQERYKEEPIRMSMD